MKSQQSRWRRILSSWRLPAAITAALLVGLAIWLTPRRIEQVTTVDERYAWNAAEAPARRQFVWEPAVAFEAVQSPAGDAPLADLRGASLIRPQLTDGGATFYFTLRRADGASDIYRSRLIDGRWENPAPFEAFNSAADDVGPVFSADGAEAYLYSNRPGGIGGFDLYVSRRSKSGWRHPENLGPGVNTPANEYDPAVAPDGKSLYFASNRTPEMQRPPAGLNPKAEEDGGPQPSRQNWSATLRAQPGLTQYDLYVAQRGASDQRWTNPRRWPAPTGRTPTRAHRRSRPTAFTCTSPPTAGAGSDPRKTSISTARGAAERS